MPWRIIIVGCVVLVLNGVGLGALPPAPAMVDWAMPWSAESPGVLSADFLIDQPAGKNGRVVIRDGHFFTGDTRLRFWGVSLAFGANFPTHPQAEELAGRFARFGINAVRFHHMDNRAFPDGIFADDLLETLSPEALDRLDYFVAALKKKGIYADLNLHVSRSYQHYHKSADGKDGPRVDKMVDLFDPELIAAQKKYAADLLGHMNAYTHARYADEPAVAMVEINNENSLFMWSSREKLASLPEPYATTLRQQWNQWLLSRYGTREKLRVAWAGGEEALDGGILQDGDFQSLQGNRQPRAWNVEQHEAAEMTAAFAPERVGDSTPRGAVLNVTAVDGIAWHLQLVQPGVHLERGRAYTVRFEARADKDTTIGVSISQAHEPWQNLGLSASAVVRAKPGFFSYSFTATESENNARLSFSVGHDPATIYLARAELRHGGRYGLAGTEDPAKNSIAVLDPALSLTPGRVADWYEFLQQTEQKYYVAMEDYLKKEAGVKCPITGTIGFGPLGTRTQAKMDFVDAHAYWDHPQFPHRQWDASDWMINNTAMVDSPEHATLWGLAATRVVGKPFTVTEYNHAAPNEWEAECIPFISTYAAMQDWDGVFLFAYSHSNEFEKTRMTDFFNIEGNPLKMPLVAMGARVFLSGAVPPLPSSVTRSLSHEELLLGNAHFNTDQGDFLRIGLGQKWEHMLTRRMSIDFDLPSSMSGTSGQSPVSWTAAGPGSGRYIYGDSHAAVFVGFAAGTMPVDLGNIKIESLQTPFATIMILPADPGKNIEQSDRLLLTAVARAENTNMHWDAARRTVSANWGTAPTRIEVVRGTVSLPGQWKHATPLDGAGNRTNQNVAQSAADRTVIRLGETSTIWYEISK